MTRGVNFSPEAGKQILKLYTYIADARSADVASGYVSAILDFCQSLGEFPHRGVARDDLRLGLRTIGFRRRVTIAFAVDKDERVTIVGVFYEHLVARSSGRLVRNPGRSGHFWAVGQTDQFCGTRQGGFCRTPVLD
ncbi:MAG: type II toxin-antitoxin system RelE/ParE family toxin [Micromonosporaceae bacterium]